jgi:hypothetical protein
MALWLVLGKFTKQLRKANNSSCNYRKQDAVYCGNNLTYTKFRIMNCNYELRTHRNLVTSLLINPVVSLMKYRPTCLFSWKVKACIYLKKISLYPKDINVFDICCGCSAVQPKTSSNYILKRSCQINFPRKTLFTLQRKTAVRPTNLKVNSSRNKGLNYTLPLSVEYEI